MIDKHRAARQPATLGASPTRLATSSRQCTAPATLQRYIYIIIGGGYRPWNLQREECDCIGAGVPSCAIMGWLFYATEYGDTTGTVVRVLE
jgi:hypothetical protein